MTWDNSRGVYARPIPSPHTAHLNALGLSPAEWDRAGTILAWSMLSRRNTRSCTGRRKPKPPSRVAGRRRETNGTPIHISRGSTIITTTLQLLPPFMQAGISAVSMLSYTANTCFTQQPPCTTGIATNTSGAQFTHTTYQSRSHASSPWQLASGQEPHPQALLAGTEAGRGN